MTNKLTSPVFTEKEWGTEIIWTITDSYMAKTIEIDPHRITELKVYDKKEKSIIVVENTLSLAVGRCCSEEDLEYYDLPEGWTYYIAPGYMHRYGGTSEGVKIVEISSPQLDEGIIVAEKGVIL
jgi:hypothetical protein